MSSGGDLYVEDLERVCEEGDLWEPFDPDWLPNGAARPSSPSLFGESAPPPSSTNLELLDLCESFAKQNKILREELEKNEDAAHKAGIAEKALQKKINELKNNLDKLEDIIDERDDAMDSMAETLNLNAIEIGRHLGKIKSLKRELASTNEMVESNKRARVEGAFGSWE